MALITARDKLLKKIRNAHKMTLNYIRKNCNTCVFLFRKKLFVQQ